MERVPNSVPVRLKAMPAGGHPDPDLLAALAEQVLPERERAQVLLHLSRCTDCREVLALAIPPAAATASPSLDTGRRSWFQWRVLRWAAAGACVVIVGSAVLMKRGTMMTARQEMLRTDMAASLQTRSDSSAYTTPEASAPTAKATAEQETVKGTADVERAIADKATQVKALKKETPVLNASPAAPPKLGLSIKPQGLVAGVGAGGGVGGGMGAGMVSRSPQQVAAAPGARSAASAGASQDYTFTAPSQPERELSKQARNTTNPEVSGQNEEIEVQAASPAVQTEQTATSEEKHEAPGKAKAAAIAPALGRVQSADGLPLRSFEDSSTNKVARAKSAVGAVGAYSPVSRWTISSDGQLQHSTDAGKTWQPVAVAEKTSFRALSANGPDLWVGGASGQLYHSTDAGSHWAQVKPTSGDSALAGDIAAIEFADTRQGKVTTANGDIWLTHDGGQNWSKQP
jgi:hypothetical protein